MLGLITVVPVHRTRTILLPIKETRLFFCTTDLHNDDEVRQGYVYILP